MYSYSENRQRIFLIAVILCLWTVYLLQRSLIGFDIVSDERFFLYVDAAGQSKRRLYLYLVQFLGNDDVGRIILSSLNIFLVICSFNLLVKINHGLVALTFLQVIYFASIASYIFRDSLILFCVSAIAFGFRKGQSGMRWYMLLPLVLLVDLRPHAALVSLVAIAWVWALNAARKRHVTFWFLGLFAIISLSAWDFMLNTVVLRGVTAGDFLGYLQKHNGYGPGLLSFIEILVRHYLAPIPTSLLVRVFDPVMESPYGNIDDLYRLVYKTTLYGVIGYIIVNVKNIADAIRLNVGLFNFLAVFSVGNAVIYSLFSGGGGHERTKIFSTLVIFYTAAALHRIHVTNKSASDEK